MRVEFPECRVELTAGPLLKYRHSQHGAGQGYWGGAPPPPPHPREAQTYRVSFPKYLLRIRGPVAGCLGGVPSRTNLLIQFTHLYVRDTIFILE